MSTAPDVADGHTGPSEAHSLPQRCGTHWPLRSLQIVIVALLLGYLVWNSLYFFPYIVDDAFISLRYARNLVNGAGLVYNPGQHVEGYSNFSWVMIESLLIRLHLPLITSIKLLGLASAVATALLSFPDNNRPLATGEAIMMRGSVQGPEGYTVTLHKEKCSLCRKLNHRFDDVNFPPITIYSTPAAVTLTDPNSALLPTPWIVPALNVPT